jgi:hypothetical protein
LIISKHFYSTDATDDERETIREVISVYFKKHFQHTLDFTGTFHFIHVLILSCNTTFLQHSLQIPHSSTRCCNSMMFGGFRSLLAM